MLNKKFRDNWRAILKYNSNIDLGEKFRIVDTKVKIPLFSIEVDPFLLYHLFNVLYPKFINDQQNIVDIIITNDHKEVISQYLYETKKAGIHEVIEKLPTDFFKFHRKDFENIDRFYDRIMDVMSKKKGIRVSSIRIFKKKAIDIINQHCIGMEDIPRDILIMNVLDLVQILFEQELIEIYPEPNFIKFLKEFLAFLDGIKLKKLFRLMYLLLPEFNLSFIFGSKHLLIILHLQKVILSKNDKPYLVFKLLTPNDLNVNLDGLTKNEILEVVRENLKSEKVYYINQNDIISILEDIFNYQVNLKEEDLQFLFQKLLFGFRDYENHWYIRPKPSIYNTLQRFLLKLLGYNINLRKVSHWAIPPLFFTMFTNFFGLNSKILVIISDTSDDKNSKINYYKYLEDHSRYVVLLEVENKTLVKIHSINKKKLKLEGELTSFESLRLKLSNQYGFISNILILDKILLQNLIREFIFGHSKLSLFSKLKTLKMLKNQKYFYMFPEIPLYQLIQKKRTLSLIKLILPILIDKHEF
ncbi:MAG: hypothetical protein ACFFEN_16515 [Candidatus Thorarchaeota archaeon]